MTAAVWRANVGRVPLFLLDADVDSNRDEDRRITASLYGGDEEMRIRQEMLLGIGGMRSLAALGIQPTVFHMNEGHSAFLGLERIGQLMRQQSLSFSEAREVVAAGTVFTTHTPVPAGIDVFEPGLVERYLGGYADEIGLAVKEIMALGQTPNDPRFSMAVLALRLSRCHNGVSRLHGEVSRRMWQHLWPQLPIHDVPISHVTNGVHASSWISGDMAHLFDRYMPGWEEKPHEAHIWQGVKTIPATELWRTRELRRERLIVFVRRRLQETLRRHGAPPRDIALAGEVLDPEALTIGFGRRFATYKRAALLLNDVDRLGSLLTDPQRPVQIIVAGKAHPRDEAGKALIQQVVRLARQQEFRRHLVFVENYDLATARTLVQGVDLWLNTPRRPNEACGTSGMKAMLNGALNLSTLDGWWEEAYDVTLGWSIGLGEEYEDDAYQDEVESQALFEVLEKEVVPLFYRREGDGLPRAWMERMKASMSQLGHIYNARRMLLDYDRQSYKVAAERGDQYLADGAMRARAVAAWKAKMRAGWSAISMRSIVDKRAETPRVGEDIAVEAAIVLGRLAPDDVVVELCHGRTATDGTLQRAESVQMDWVGSSASGESLFRGKLSSRMSGRHGYAVRVRGRFEKGDDPFEPGLILWA